MTQKIDQYRNIFDIHVWNEFHNMQIAMTC